MPGKTFKLAVHQHANGRETASTSPVTVQTARVPDVWRSGFVAIRRIAMALILVLEHNEVLIHDLGLVRAPELDVRSIDDPLCLDLLLDDCLVCVVPVLALGTVACRDVL